MALAIKIKRFMTAGDVPNTSELVDGEIAVNIADKKIYVRDGSTVVEMTADLSAVAEDIIPDGDGTRDLGSSSKRWKDIYLSSDSIDLAGATISSDGTGSLAIEATGATLPAGSKDADGLSFALTGTSGASKGQVISKVPFYTNEDGTSTPAAHLKFNGTIDDRNVFTDHHTFTKSTGSNQAEDSIILFQL